MSTDRSSTSDLSAVSERHRPEPDGSAMTNLLAWVVIVLTCSALVLLPQLDSADENEKSTAAGAGSMMTELMGRYAVGAGSIDRAQASRFYEQLEPQLNVGPVPQRQRFVILAAELAGPEQARVVLEELDELIAQAEAERPPDADPLMSESQARVQALLHRLYPPAEEVNDDARIALDALTEADRRFLRDELGWFGELAMVPEEHVSRSERRVILADARRVTFTMVGVMVALCALGFLGVVGIVLVLIGFGTGRLRWHFRSGSGAVSVYAESFAIWLIVFFALQIAAQVVTATGNATSFRFGAAFLAFFISLLAVFWPVIRGVPWRTVREDIGLTLGRRPLAEPAIGFAGYAMGLPVLVLGAICTLLLMMVAGLFAEPASPLSPSGAPVHPVALEIGGAGWLVKLQILLVAAVAAPIVEEIMFRGVLYRNLREMTCRTGRATSVIGSVGLSSYIFALIHPQGWMAIPLLMSLAIVFALVREWRDTVIPAIVIHGVSNAIIVGSMVFLLS
ncbi:MAG: CPBP family intramembrane metalloprotease [Phycisphaerales bacterium]|nr:MAG: CPBP family intramembrane metalloprotease [Phycisphaerales bacterium]